jgi:hypothetical protein
MNGKLIVPTSKLAVVAAILTAAAISAAAQDATSMASPTREPIWTARLLSIAVNDGDVEEAAAMFADSTILSIRSRGTQEGTHLAGREIEGWLHRLIETDNGRIEVQNDCVDGRTIVVDLLLIRGEDETLRRFEYTQADNGLIAELIVGPVEGELPCE